MQIIRVYCLSIINAVGHGGLGIVYNNGRKSAGSTLQQTVKEHYVFDVRCHIRRSRGMYSKSIAW